MICGEPPELRRRERVSIPSLPSLIFLLLGLNMISPSVSSLSLTPSGQGQHLIWAAGVDLDVCVITDGTLDQELDVNWTVDHRSLQTYLLPFSLLVENNNHQLWVLLVPVFCEGQVSAVPRHIHHVPETEVDTERNGGRSLVKYFFTITKVLLFTTANNLSSFIDTTVINTLLLPLGGSKLLHKKERELSLQVSLSSIPAGKSASCSTKHWLSTLWIKLWVNWNLKTIIFTLWLFFGGD